MHDRRFLHPARFATALAAVVATTVIALTLAVAPAGATTFGSDLGRAPSAGSAPACPGSSCTFVGTGLASASRHPVAAPIDGVITRVRYRSVGTHTATIRVVRLSPGTSSATGGGTGPRVTLVGGKNVEWIESLHLPVQAGDYVGLDAAAISAASCAAGGASEVYEPVLGDYAPFAASDAQGCELLVNADVEPDADGDRLGDDTQDEDDDNDAVGDATDNCSVVGNQTQADWDHDGSGDACDATPGGEGGFFDDLTPALRPPGCGAAPYRGDSRDYQAADPFAPNPLTGERWFVDPEEHSFQDWRALQKRGQTAEAALMEKVAREAKFRWFGTFTGANVAQKVRAYLERVQCARPMAVPLMALMRGQSKECHPGYMGGGKREDRAHRKWLKAFAAGIGSARVVIAYEPDSLGTIDCLNRRRRPARMRVLRYGVRLLSKLPHATVYIEAGASDWEDERSMARKLRKVGIRHVRGFMLNVTHSDWTDANIRYGRRISRLVGGKPFVVNTSISGQGPTHEFRMVSGSRKRFNIWCNAPKAGLGPRPTTQTGDSKVDAFLWIGRPGYSGGSCNGGPLPIGTWWRDRALRLAARASDRRGP